MVLCFFPAGFGSSELSGHADYFPNGGEDQPNCKNGVLKNVDIENDLYEGMLLRQICLTNNILRSCSLCCNS